MTMVILKVETASNNFMNPYLIAISVVAVSAWCFIYLSPWIGVGFLINALSIYKIPPKEKELQ